MDAASKIRCFNAGRDPERLQLKYKKMRASAFVFLRGTCHLFYDHLPVDGLFKSAPKVWLCGDLHLENFGSYKGDNRCAYFDLNDFDEALLAPASWDVVRLLTSIRVAAADLTVSPAVADHLCEAFLGAYGKALSAGKAYWVERQTASGLIGDLLTGLRDRTRLEFLASRTQLKGGKRTLRVDGKKALPATAVQRKLVMAFMHEFAQTQEAPEFYEVQDVARRIAGTGSLGVDRYAILIRGKGAPDGHYLLDLKAALPSALAGKVKGRQPNWPSEAHRIVEVQRRCQAVPMAFLQPVQVNGAAYVLRGLQPSEDRVTLDGARQSQAQIQGVVETMARMVAWGSLRSAGRQGSAIADELMDFAAGKKWKGKLLEASKYMADQVQHDAAQFNAAYDDGFFNVNG